LNSIFWLAAVVMTLIAFLIVLPPLWRKRDNTAADDLDQRNIKIARDRMAELKANKASGGINQAQFDEQVIELGQALSDDLEITHSSSKSDSQGRWLVYVLAIAIPVLSAALYWTLGDYQAINRINDPTQAAQTDPADPATPSPEAINKMVTGLAEKLKAEPNNLEGWLMLGRSYKMLQRIPEAVEAFAHAYQLAGEKVEVMLPYAEVIALSSDNNWTGKPLSLVMKALTIDPKNLNGLWFAAMANAQQGDKKTAVGYLRKLEAVLPAESPDKQQIHDLIVSSESALTNAAPAASTKSAASSGVSVAIQVNLATELQSDTKPEDTVFVYAQALSGPKMPLAIVRKQVKDLPLSVSLSDAESMLPNMKLSNFKQVRLLARISKSGNPMPQTGDLIGVIEQANLADHKKNKIVINDRVK
jgi:cytochrome c-type biogenesis protein CcmH